VSTEKSPRERVVARAGEGQRAPVRSYWRNSGFKRHKAAQPSSPRWEPCDGGVTYVVKHSVSLRRKTVWRVAGKCHAVFSAPPVVTELCLNCVGSIRMSTTYHTRLSSRKQVICILSSPEKNVKMVSSNTGGKSRKPKSARHCAKQSSKKEPLSSYQCLNPFVTRTKTYSCIDVRMHTYVCALHLVIHTSAFSLDQERYPQRRPYDKPLMCDAPSRSRAESNALVTADFVLLPPRRLLASTAGYRSRRCYPL